MASWQGSVPITGSPGTAYLTINTGYSQVDANTWHVDFNVYYQTRGGWNVARNASGGGSYGWSNGGPWGGSGQTNNDYLLQAAGFNVGVDANGNASYGLNAHISMDVNSPYNSIDAGGSESFPRIALAPPIVSLVAELVKPTTARLGIEIGGYGHGTSAAMTTFYREQGSGTWIDAGGQGDVGGYNYWPLSGLKPGKTYEYFGRAWNNNGDTSDTGVQTFKTQPVSGMIAVMKGLM